MTVYPPSHPKHIRHPDIFAYYLILTQMTISKLFSTFPSYSLYSAINKFKIFESL